MKYGFNFAVALFSNVLCHCHVKATTKVQNRIDDFLGRVVSRHDALPHFS